MRSSCLSTLAAVLVACSQGHDDPSSLPQDSALEDASTETSADAASETSSDAMDTLAPGDGPITDAADTGAAVDVGADAGPLAPVLPKATGVCPEFVAGVITVHPAGKPARKVQLYVSDAAKTKDGPLVFYWHGTSWPATSVETRLGPALIDPVLAAGGIVVSPFEDPAAGSYPWYLVTAGGVDDDLRVADEVLACAVAKIGVDVTRIHSVGHSAGALHTTQMSLRRAAYLSSVVTISGGLGFVAPDQEPRNAFAALIFHGGSSDVVAGFSFEKASQDYRSALLARGSFAPICNYKGGHSSPSGAGAATFAFFAAHPWGTKPSPWKSGLPPVITGDCTL